MPNHQGAGIAYFCNLVVYTITNLSTMQYDVLIILKRGYRYLILLTLVLFSSIVYPDNDNNTRDYGNDTIELTKLLNEAMLTWTDTIKDKGFDIDYFNDQALEIANDSFLINFIAVGADTNGVYFRNKGNYLVALKLHNWAWKLASNINNKNLNSIILNNKGVVYRRLDDYEKALSYHLEALKSAEETKNIKSQAIAINSIGNIHAMIGNLDESLEYFRESLILEQKLDNLLGIAINLNNIGNIFFMKEDFKSALDYYSHSLEVNKEIHSQKGIAICYNDIGNVHEKLGDTDKALNYYLEALLINKHLSDRYAQAYSYIQVGELYTKLKQFETALDYLIPGLEIAIDIGAKTIIMNGYHARYNISRENQEYDDAFRFLELTHKYNDSIINLNVHKEIARQQIRFDTEQQEKQIALLESNAKYNDLAIKRQNTVILLAFSALIIAIGFVVFLLYFIFSKNKTNRLLLERNKIIEKTRTELDDYSKQLLIAKQQAEENSKVKSEFLANMSHEIRTPLNSVIGFAEILSDSVTDPKHNKQIEIIKSSSRTLLNLINEILDLSKIEAGKFDVTPEPVNPTLVLDDIVNVFRQRASEKNLELRTKFKKLPNTILLNELRIRQILFNLIGNAIKFTYSGHVTISAISEPSIYEGHIKLTITVSDTGIGMSKEDLLDIFEPFHQTIPDDNKQGTGLGLTITKRLVEAMKGTIEVNSAPGKGSEFTVCFQKIQLSSEEIEREVLQIPSIESQNLVSALFVTKDPNRCIILNIPGIEKINKAIVTNLQDAKKELAENNVVIISGFKKENALNAVNVLSKIDRNQATFIVSGEFIDEISESHIKFIDPSLSISEITELLNKLFSKVGSPKKTNIYFDGLISRKNEEKLAQDFKLIYSNEFTVANESKITNSISIFVETLKGFSKKYKIQGIDLFCQELDQSVSGFDIDAMEELLRIFQNASTEVLKQ